MAMVRSIEQLYWGLAQQYAKLWAAEWAEGQTEGILGREREELKLGRATTADVAEANQRLEQCRLDLVNATTGVINIERQLRHVLGLPVADNRRIIPVTAAVEAKVEPDREASLSAMLLNQPDVVRAREKANAKHVDLDEIVRTLLPDLAPRKTTVPPYTPPRKKSISLGSVELEQVVQQATHTLSRFLLEVETDYEQYQTAKRIRNAADERLAAQRAYYKEGRITIDRLLDAVKQYADAVAQEAQFKADYNIAIVALEEAKGTLLENDKISLVEAPSTGAAGVVDAGAAAAAEPTAAPEPVGRAKPAEPQGRTMAFEATIRVGAIPIEIRGSVTVGPAAAPDSEGR
jgi:outer membrane protein TolC